MKIKNIIQQLENFAPISLQENYDNAGLIIGDAEASITGIIISLDCTETVVDEAIANNCNLIVAHHPIIFAGLKKINGKNYIERTVIKAIKNDVAIYAIHTNLDNVYDGVNKKIADKIELKNTRILTSKKGLLKKLVTYVPVKFAENIKEKLFEAGAGNIGNYSHCSFTTQGFGTYTANTHAKPFAGLAEKLHIENETRIETIYPLYLETQVIEALIKNHPYEEVSYDIYSTEIKHNKVGSGIIGELQQEMTPKDFLHYLKIKMELDVIRFTSFNKNIKQVAICGGAGSFLLKDALTQKADALITADFKYHEFFDAEQSLMITDIGHYESEKFTKELLSDLILKNNPTFAVLLSKTNTNPVSYFY